MAEHPSDTHFFLSSFATWITTGPNRTLKQAMAALDREGYAYNVWAVPLPPNAEYEIKGWAPQVKGALFMAEVEPKPRKKRSKT